MRPKRRRLFGPPGLAGPLGGASAVCTLLAVLISSVSSAAASGQDPSSGRKGLLKISLEELVNIEVSSVSRKSQKLSETAAAVYVLSGEDILRSGATSIPEALRMVPGLQVARIDSSKWAISARGFNRRFANKMLVLMDGRSIYNNIYSGVYWDQYDVLLEDIDRIEVIRGPGATMWGANAVNGVINIITRPAAQTQGTMVTAGGGTEDRAEFTARHGGEAGDKIQYRMWAKRFDRSGLHTGTGTPGDDTWDSSRGGARVDWKASENDAFTFHGEAHSGVRGQVVQSDWPIAAGPLISDTVRTSGSYALARWERRFSERSEMVLQGGVDDQSRREWIGNGSFRQWDLDFQHRYSASSRHDLLWGAGYRRLSDQIETGRYLFTPAHRGDNLASAFLQDDISLLDDRFVLTIGSKFQHNDYSGFEIQPTVRALWAPGPRQGVWFAVSRAVRTPARVDHDLNFEFDVPVPGPLPGIGRILPGRGFRSEVLVGYETGYRRQLNKRLGLDITGFYNDYSSLQSLSLQEPFLEFEPQPRIVVPQSFTNSIDGETYGMEVVGSWTPSSMWKLVGSYSGIIVQMHGAGVDSTHTVTADGTSPRHQVHLRSELDLTERLRLDTALYRVAALPALAIPAYTRVDASVGWRFLDCARLSFTVQNLLDDRHPEFVSEDYVRNVEIGRAFFVKTIWEF